MLVRVCGLFFVIVVGCGGNVSGSLDQRGGPTDNDASDDDNGDTNGTISDDGGSDNDSTDTDTDTCPGGDCTPLPTEWVPYTADQNYLNGTITGFPMTLSYAEAGVMYRSWIPDLPNGTPTGTCEVIGDALLGVAPAMRCTFTHTHEEATNPALGGDPYGFGQTYLGPDTLVVDESLGAVTAMSVTFVWQFGDGWLEAQEYRDEHREDLLWGGAYADVNVGGAGGKPLILQRRGCEYWFDVSTQVATGPTSTISGTLNAPDGLITDSVEIVVGNGSVYARGDGNDLRNQAGNVVGSIATNGTYSLTLTVPSGSVAIAYYRTRPPSDNPELPRYRNSGLWREPLGSDGCRERPMMLAHTIEDWTDGFDPLPAMALTVADDIACYCWDYDGETCQDFTETDARKVEFRVGSTEHDDEAAGIYHVGVAEPLFVEMLVDTVNDVLDMRVTTPDGRFNDTLVSHSSFCDSANNAAARYNDNPHRYGRIIQLGEPFWTLPVTSVPPRTYHQVGQWRVTGATNGATLSRQGPPPGFVRP